MARQRMWWNKLSRIPFSVKVLLTIKHSDSVLSFNELREDGLNAKSLSAWLPKMMKDGLLDSYGQTVRGGVARRYFLTNKGEKFLERYLYSLSEDLEKLFDLAYMGRPYGASRPEGMEEKVACHVVSKYLEKCQVRFKMRKANEAGPDILVDGVAVEVKGSNLNERETLIQLARYSSEYAGLTFAFPLNKLTLSLLYSLYYLEAATRNLNVLKPRSIRVVLLAQMNGSYFVGEFESVSTLLKEIDSKIAAKAALPHDTKLQQIELLLTPDLLDIDDVVQAVMMQELTRCPTAYKLDVD